MSRTRSSSVALGQLQLSSQPAQSGKSKGWIIWIWIGMLWIAQVFQQSQTFSHLICRHIRSYKCLVSCVVQKSCLTHIFQNTSLGVQFFFTPSIPHREPRVGFLDRPWRMLGPRCCSAHCRYSPVVKSHLLGGSQVYWAGRVAKECGVV